MTDPDIEDYVSEKLGWRIIVLSKEYQHYGIEFNGNDGRTAEPHEVAAFNFAVSTEKARREEYEARHQCEYYREETSARNAELRTKLLTETIRREKAEEYIEMLEANQSPGTPHASGNISESRQAWQQSRENT